MGKRFYVDKTHFMYVMIYLTGKDLIIVLRPRRFGKSLFLSAIKAFFEGMDELFEDLDIMQELADAEEKAKPSDEESANEYNMMVAEKIKRIGQTEFEKLLKNNKFPVGPERFQNPLKYSMIGVVLFLLNFQRFRVNNLGILRRVF